MKKIKKKPNLLFFPPFTRPSFSPLLFFLLLLPNLYLLLPAAASLHRPSFPASASSDSRRCPASAAACCCSILHRRPSLLPPAPAAAPPHCFGSVLLPHCFGSVLSPHCCFGSSSSLLLRFFLQPASVLPPHCLLHARIAVGNSIGSSSARRSCTGRRVQWSSFVCCSLSASSTEEGFSARERLDRDRNRRCLCFDLHNEVVPYKRAWLFQKFLVERRHALTEKDEDHADTVIVLQHCPVYTLGTNSTEEYLNFEMKDAPFDIFRTERGGEVTYHGPGQLVMYPILNLRYHKMDLHWYLRSLEEVVIRVLESSFSIKATRQNGLTGVWVGNEKVAAVGIRVTRWITYHGLALNVNTDLSPFQHIVPCGIRDRQVGSIEGILKRSGCEQTGVEDLIEIVHKSLLEEFSEVFQLSLQFKSTSDTSTEDSGWLQQGNEYLIVQE